MRSYEYYVCPFFLLYIYQFHPDEGRHATENLEAPEMQKLSLVVFTCIKAEAGDPKTKSCEKKTVGNQVDNGPEALFNG